MALKLFILLLFIGVIASLTGSLVFLLKDIESPTKRTLYALGIRVTFAAALLTTIFFGLYTGQLGSGAPWDKVISKDRMEHLE